MGTAFQLKPSKKIAAAFIGTLMIAVPVVSNWEGLWLTAKPDTLAYSIPTVCYGETEGVKVGDKYTKEQCQQMLAEKLPRYLKEINACIHVPVSDKTRAAYLSFAYNVGSSGFCHSSANARLHDGDYVGSCNALRSWNKAGGRYIQGLANRRADERELCLEGIDEPRKRL